MQSPFVSSQCTEDSSRDVKSPSSTANLFWMLVLANALIGLGSSTLQPLGVSYIDDYTEKHTTPIYIGKKLV